MLANKRFREWVHRLERALTSFPPERNFIRPPVEAASVPHALLPLYAVCDGLWLADVDAGLFLEPSAVVARDTDSRIRLFGRDGTGGRFALRLADESVVHLPSGRNVGDTVLDFLQWLESDVHAISERDHAHHFLVSEHQHP